MQTFGGKGMEGDYRMNYYLAPLEGITTYVYRNAYHSCFESMDKYFSPFITPHVKRDFNSRELNDILPDHNKGLYLVPQILTNKSEDFIRTARALEQYGYKEVNLNLGCPSGTVVSKGKGAGFLAKPHELNRFLEEIFEGLNMDISIKTRIGIDSAEEFSGLLQIFNEYPVKELIIHPRVQTDFYKNIPNLSIYEQAIAESKNPVCYNGDIFTTEKLEEIKEKFPTLENIMLGRGILQNPALLYNRESGKMPEIKQLKEFHDLLYKGYKEINFGDKNVLFKMKELWGYMIKSFDGSEKYGKRIRKAERCIDYEVVITDLFSHYRGSFPRFTRIE